MSDNKTTPGPWEVDGFAVIGPGMVTTWADGKMSLKNETICRITAKDDTETDRANARLIAAAPLMMKALEASEAATAIDVKHSGLVYADHYDARNDDARAEVREAYSQANKLMRGALAAARPVAKETAP
jgi:hypothetical protein